MANADHLELLRQKVDLWNSWGKEKPSVVPDLSGADLRWAFLDKAFLSRANLEHATLSYAKLAGANLSEANLNYAQLGSAHLWRANLSGASLFRADLGKALVNQANLSKVDMREAHLWHTVLTDTDLTGATLTFSRFVDAELNRAILTDADLRWADLGNAKLENAKLVRAKLTEARLSGAVLANASLQGADLDHSLMVNVDLVGADLTGCHVYGTSAWGLKLNAGTKQQNLVITPQCEPEITIDNIEVAQFVYLLLHNEKIRDVIDTIGRKGVLLLGRFTGGRIAVLERLRAELRNRGFLPMVFNFEKPETKDFTETVRLLAGLSHFVIVDITNPRSAPLELQAAVPDCMVPFVPILEKGEEPFAMLENLWVKHREWVLEPIRYPSVDRLIEVLDAEVVKPAQARFAELLLRKAGKLQVRDI